MKSTMMYLSFAGFIMLFSTHVAAQTSVTTAKFQQTTSSSPSSCPIVMATIAPTYGPRSGSTSITVAGIGNTQTVTNVAVCQLQSGSSGDCQIVNTTGNIFKAPFPATGSVSGLSVFVNTATCSNVSAGHFTFINDPSSLVPISLPIQMLVKGGTQLWLQGEGVNSSSAPRLFVSNSIGSQSPVAGACTSLNSTILACSTPDVSSLVTSGLVNNGSRINGVFRPFVMFDNFRLNVSATIEVYQFPNLTADPVNQTFINDKNLTITIKGSQLTNHGFTKDDIVITVGDAGNTWATGSNQCMNVILANTTITCQPPSKRTDVISFDFPAEPESVHIRIGNQQSSDLVLYLQYTPDQSFSIIMIVMIGILGSVIIVSLICVVLTYYGCGRRPETSHSTAAAVPYSPLTVDETKAMTSSVKDESHTSKRARKSKLSMKNKPVDSGIQVKAVRKTSEIDGNENTAYSGDVHL